MLPPTPRELLCSLSPPHFRVWAFGSAVIAVQARGMGLGACLAFVSALGAQIPPRANSISELANGKGRRNGFRRPVGAVRRP